MTEAHLDAELLELAERAKALNAERAQVLKALEAQGADSDEIRVLELSLDLIGAKHQVIWRRMIRLPAKTAAGACAKARASAGYFTPGDGPGDLEDITAESVLMSAAADLQALAA